MRRRRRTLGVWLYDTLDCLADVATSLLMVVLAVVFFAALGAVVVAVVARALS